MDSWEALKEELVKQWERPPRLYAWFLLLVGSGLVFVGIRGMLNPRSAFFVRGAERVDPAGVYERRLEELAATSLNLIQLREYLVHFDGRW